MALLVQSGPLTVELHLNAEGKWPSTELEEDPALQNLRDGLSWCLVLNQARATGHQLGGLSPVENLINIINKE